MQRSINCCGSNTITLSGMMLAAGFLSQTSLATGGASMATALFSSVATSFMCEDGRDPCAARPWEGDISRPNSPMSGSYPTSWLISHCPVTHPTGALCADIKRMLRDLTLGHAIHHCRPDGVSLTFASRPRRGARDAWRD